MSDSELQSLIDSLLDNEISEADFLRLEAELQIRPEVRQRYYDTLRLDSLLSTESEEASSITAPHPDSQGWKTPALATAAGIALLASALGGWFLGNKPSPEITQNPDQEPVAVGFGIITETSDATWRDADASVKRGDLIPTGQLNLTSGLVKLELFSGVNVIVEGAAEFELISPMEMRVANGKVRALVPEPARGFRIHTPTGQLVDLGTEFSMEITADHADVHVLDGEVEWHPKTAAQQNLTGGEAMRWESSGESNPITPEKRSIADIESTLETELQQRRSSWLAKTQIISSGQNSVAYFPIQPIGEASRKLTDISPNHLDAAIVQAHHVTDRWGHPNAALDFSPTGSRARLNIPGEFQSLTFVCWARIDSLDRQFNSLFLTDGHEIGEPHWQIMHDGRLFFSVKKREWESPEKSDKHIFYSPPIWNATMSGRWIQIATTYDHASRRVTHFIDGRSISSESVPDGYLVDTVKIGAASIGNWSEPKRSDPTFAIRNLNGAIDEFAIYSEALSPERIAELYHFGKP